MRIRCTFLKLFVMNSFRENSFYCLCNFCGNLLLFSPSPFMVVLYKVILIETFCYLFMYKG